MSEEKLEFELKDLGKDRIVNGELCEIVKIEESNEHLEVKFKKLD